MQKNKIIRKPDYLRQPAFYFVIFLFLFVTIATAQADYRLIGTIEGKGFTGAVLDDSTGVQTLYRLHERLPDGSQIVKVRSDSISLKRSDGTPYELFIVHDAKPSSPQGRTGAVPPTVVSPPVAVQQAPALVDPARSAENLSQMKKERLSRRRRARSQREEE